MWITPWNEAEHVLTFARAEGFDQYVSLFESRLQLGSTEAIVARAWDVDEVRERYAEFAEEFAQKVTPAPRGREVFETYVRAFNTYRRFPYMDPGLPHEVFPVRRERDRACEIFAKIEMHLRDEATAYFAAKSESGSR